MIAIGSSTGGPQALATLLKTLPGDFPVPIVVVQHMPPVFTKHLAERLDAECSLSVREASAGDIVRPGQVLIAAGDYHIAIARKGVAVCCELNQGPPENSCRPAVDVLFRSAANLYGAGCLGVVLTGMGQDGLRGACEIVANRGGVIAQDQASCIVWGMPRAVTEAGLAYRVLPLKSIAKEMMRQVRVGRRVFQGS